MEQLLFLLLMLVGVALLNFVARRLKARAAPPSAEPPSSVAIDIRPPRTALPRITSSVSETPVAPTPAAAAPSRSRRRLGSRSELRRAIVLMAVLGPCRALGREERAAQTPAES